jgi:transcription elongation factor GreA
VGSEEADAATGKISHHSAVGAALLGKKKGDEVVVRTPKGESRYRIAGVK